MTALHPEPPREHARVVVGIDGSPASAGVLAAAEQERRFRSGELLVVGVWHMPTTYGWAFPTRFAEDLKSQARSTLHAVIRNFYGNSAPPDVSLTLEEGHAGAVLCRVAADADLLVVGSRGHAALPGTRLGSVSMHCAHSAPCPLLIVPAGAAPFPEHAEHAQQDVAPLQASRSGEAGADAAPNVS